MSNEPRRYPPFRSTVGPGYRERASRWETAERLAAQIRRAWAACGETVEVRVVAWGDGGTKNGSGVAVESDLRNGWPT